MPATTNEMGTCLGVIAGATAGELQQIRAAYSARLRELNAVGQQQWRRGQTVEFTDRSGQVVRGRIKTVNEKTVTLEGCFEQMFGANVPAFQNGVRVPFSMLRAVSTPVNTPAQARAAARQFEAAVVPAGPADADDDL